jgi:phage terminase large subunit-like protein
LGKSIKLEYLRAEAKRAETELSYENTFRRLHLGQWPQNVSRWLRLEDWEACKTELPNLSGQPCFGGLDLSTTTDISAFVLAFPVDELVYLLPHFWIPERKLRESRDNVPYDAWERQGLLTITEGDVIDYTRIEADIAVLGKRYAVQEIRVDPWNSTMLSTQLSEQHGFHIADMRQGFITMNAPTKEFEKRVIGKQIGHDGNEVLAWMVSNVAVRSDPAGNIKPDKGKSTERIDGVVAAIMALSGTMSVAKKPSIYKERGLISL